MGSSQPQGRGRSHLPRTADRGAAPQAAFRAKSWLNIEGVSIPMSQTFPGHSPPQNKQKSSYQHGSKNEQVPRHPVLCRNLRIAIKTAELPFHIRYDSHVTAVASYNKQVFIVHA